MAQLNGAICGGLNRRKGFFYRRNKETRLIRVSYIVVKGEKKPPAKRVKEKNPTRDFLKR